MRGIYEERSKEGKGHALKKMKGAGRKGVEEEMEKHTKKEKKKW